VSGSPGWLLRRCGSDGGDSCGDFFNRHLGSSCRNLLQVTTIFPNLSLSNQPLDDLVCGIPVDPKRATSFKITLVGITLLDPQLAEPDLSCGERRWFGLVPEFAFLFGHTDW
jgi:hypothetical protein